MLTYVNIDRVKKSETGWPNVKGQSALIIEKKKKYKSTSKWPLMMHLCHIVMGGCKYTNCKLSYSKFCI